MSASADISIQTELGLIKCLVGVAADMASNFRIDVPPGSLEVERLTSLLTVALDRTEALDAAYAALIREGAVACS